MNKKVCKRLIIIIMCILLSCMFISSSILGADIEHLSTCHEEHCLQCAMIHQAQNNSNSLTIIMTFYFIAIIIIQLLKKFNIKDFFSQTLVDLNIQFNE